jgi:hypothetical protein
MAQFVEAVHYKSEGRGFGIFHWLNSSCRTMAVVSTQPLTKWVSEISVGGGGGKDVGLTTVFRYKVHKGMKSLKLWSVYSQWLYVLCRLEGGIWRPYVEFLSTKGDIHRNTTEGNPSICVTWYIRFSHPVWYSKLPPVCDLTASFHASSLPGFQGNIIDWKWSQYFLLVILFANIAALRAGVE